MKCPWQTKEEHWQKEIDVYGRLISPETKTVVFADCIGEECPFCKPTIHVGVYECKRVKDEE